jgi:homogentisate 1,2-dioxygenase
MIDPFKPLMITEYALAIEDASYHTSWQHNIE